MPRITETSGKAHKSSKHLSHVLLTQVASDVMYKGVSRAFNLIEISSPLSNLQNRIADLFVKMGLISIGLKI